MPVPLFDMADAQLAGSRLALYIEHPGFKTVTETVQVDANNSVHKRYTLLPE